MLLWRATCLSHSGPSPANALTANTKGADRMQTTRSPGVTLDDMSLDQDRTQTDYSPRPPRRGGGKRIAVIVGVLVTVLAVAGVGLVITSADRQPGGLVLTQPSAAPPAPSVDPVPPAPAELTVEEQILSQYRKFHAVLDTLPDIPAAERPGVLREVASDPQYTSSLELVAAADAAGETFYGTGSLNPRGVIIGQAAAVVRDCQDNSQTGQLRRSDGKKLTVGLPAELAVTQVKRGPDGIWRVAEIVYPTDQSC